jgi:hypothetical protein
MLQLQLPRTSTQGRQDTDATARVFKDGRIQGKAFALSTAAPDRLATARTFVHALVAAWWRALTTGDRRPVPLREPLQPLALSPLPEPACALALKELVASRTSLAGPGFAGSPHVLWRHPHEGWR